MRRLPVLIIFLLWFPSTWASEEEVIIATMRDYWRSFSSGNFRDAAGYIDPVHLAELRDGLVPVFLRVAESDKEELVRVADIFFNDVPREERARITPRKAYLNLNQFIQTSSPQMFEVLAKSAISIESVELQDDAAQLRYRVIVNDTYYEDAEAFALRDGLWYLRLKESPAETASKFAALLNSK